MTKRKTLKEFESGRGYTKADWDEVSDDSEMTDEQLAQAKPFAEVFPELAASIRQKSESRVRDGDDSEEK